MTEDEWFSDWARPCAPMVTCAAEPCSADAVIEIIAEPGDGTRVWVPLCDPHVHNPPSEYIVEVHGFTRR